jgi:hypothetical protein
MKKHFLVMIGFLTVVNKILMVPMVVMGMITTSPVRVAAFCFVFFPIYWGVFGLLNNFRISFVFLLTRALTNFFDNFEDIVLIENLE